MPSGSNRFVPFERLRRLLALQIQRNGRLNKVLQSGLVNLVVFMNVDGASDRPVLVEEVRGVVQRSTLEESKLDRILVDLPRTDAAIV